MDRERNMGTRIAEERCGDEVWVGEHRRVRGWRAMGEELE